MVGRQGQEQKQQGAGCGEEEGAVTMVSPMWVEELGPKFESEGHQVVALYDAAGVVEDAVSDEEVVMESLVVWKVEAAVLLEVAVVWLVGAAE